MGPRENYLLVAAIDFGTAYSGYAFSRVDDFKKDPLKVQSHTWKAGTRALMSNKASTCALFDKNKKFHSFGYEAEDKYSDLTLDNEADDWYFFQRFKMTLFDKLTLKRRFMLEDIKGRKMQAIEVFSACIKYLKEHLENTCKLACPDLKPEDIRWVLTVPAIWNDASKQFMREAAEKAGMDTDALLIALEPEAASLCCRYLPMNTFKGVSSGFVPFAPGSKYLVFDAGGGTIDITIHQIQPDDTLRELYKANGGNWGGTYVDKAFRDLLADIVGNDVMDSLAESKTSDYFDLFREFEVKKRTFDSKMNDKITFKVPIAIQEEFRARHRQEIKDHLKAKPKYDNKVTWVSDKLRMDADTAKDLFKDACESIASHLQTLFQDGEIDDVPCILMVGGFSESPMLQNAIKCCLPGKRVIVPADPGLAVLKGAVIFGHNPTVIKERRCRFTYGVRTSYQFDPRKHPESKKFQNDAGNDYCGDIFDRHVEIGKPVVTGERQAQRSYVPTRNDACELTIPVFASDQCHPDFTTDPSCKCLGNINVSLDGYGLDRPVKVQMVFGDTELHVEAVEEKTGRKTKAKFDFLG